MRWLVIIFALAFSAPAFALSSASNASQNSATTPPDGRAADCGAWQLAAPVSGRTTLAVRISETGDVVAASVQHTSGNPDLDAAALACAKHMYIPSPTVGGRPVEVTWIVIVKWSRIGKSTYLVPLFVQDNTACGYRPLIAQGISGEAILSVHIGADGKVQKATLARSSGALIVDEESVHCASSWVYPPVLIDGRPSEIDWITGMEWEPAPSLPD